MPDRQAITLSDWLKGHAQVEIITRDQSLKFALACQSGAPQAQQVLDRWHLLRNLREIVERTLRELPSTGLVPSSPIVGRTTAALVAAQASRAARLKRYELVKACQAQGLSIRQTARQLHFSRAVVATFYRAAVFPEQSRRSAGGQTLMPFQAYLQAYWDRGERNAMRAWLDVQALGFQGSRHVVARWFRQRREHPAPLRQSGI